MTDRALPGKPEGATWTEQDERRMQWWAKDHDGQRIEVRFAREILRLRAERDREEQHHAAIRAENVKLRGEYADAIEAKFAELRSALLSSPSAPDTRSPSGTGSAWHDQFSEADRAADLSVFDKMPARSPEVEEAGEAPYGVICTIGGRRLLVDRTDEDAPIATFTDDAEATRFSEWLTRPASRFSGREDKNGE